MNPYKFLSSFLQRAPGVATAISAFAALAFAANVQAAPIAISDFETGPDGWEGLACPNPGICALGTATIDIDHQATGGNPGGYIRTRDPNSSTAGRAEPPAKFSDNYAIGQILSFDALVERNSMDASADFDGNQAPLVTIEGSGGTLVFVIPESEFPKIDELDGIDGNDWKHYEVPLSDVPPSGVGTWLIFDGTVRALNPGEFASVFGSPTIRLTLISEWLKDQEDKDTGGLDNVQLQAVPVPAALPLLLSALVGFGFTAKRRG